MKFPYSKNSQAHLTSDVHIDRFFPEEDANFIALNESYNKHLFRPNTYLHKWWARRAGTTFRYVLKQLVPNIKLRDYYEPGGLEGVTVLDPMIGGGTIIHEAIRLGANVIGYDIDPIPILQAKASLKNIPILEKEEIFENFISNLREKVSKYFITECPSCKNSSAIQFTLYGLRKSYNLKEALIVDSFLIREENNSSLTSLNDFYPDKNVDYGRKSFEILDKQIIKEQGVFWKYKDLLKEKLYKRYVPLIIVGKCNEHGTFYKKIDSSDIEIIDRAKAEIQKLNMVNSSRFVIPYGPKSQDLLKKGIKYFTDLFTPRQLVYLNEAKILLDTLPDAHKLWMSLLISTSLEFNSLLCGYKGAEKRRPGAIRHVFSHHAYSIPYTALENNPVYSEKSSGSLLRLFESRIKIAGKWALSPIERYFENGKWKKKIIFGEFDCGYECESIADFSGRQKCLILDQNDSAELPIPDQSVDFIVTDPPYYDNVQYSDLSHFFRCWLGWFLPNKANWTYKTKNSAVAESKETEIKFGETLNKIWKECNRVLRRPHGRLIFTYHHWKADAWIQLSLSLLNARFKLNNSFIVHSENPISVHINNLKALKHDSILVLSPDDGKFNKKWRKPDSISSSNSSEFCEGCAELLGWMLDNIPKSDEISNIWRNLLKVK